MDTHNAQPLIFGIRDRIARGLWQRDIPRVATIAALAVSEDYAEAVIQARRIEDEELRQALVARYASLADAQAAPPQTADPPRQAPQEDTHERAYARAEEILAGLLEKLDAAEVRLLAALVLNIEYDDTFTLEELREGLWEELTDRAYCYRRETLERLATE